MGYLYLVSVKTLGVMYDNTVLIGMVSRGREGAMEGKREGGREVDLGCLLTPGFRKDIQCHV